MVNFLFSFFTSWRPRFPPLNTHAERPRPHCDHCGIALRPPGAIIEYCPGCNRLLPELPPDGVRPIAHCPECGCSLLSPKRGPLTHPPINPAGRKTRNSANLCSPSSSAPPARTQCSIRRGPKLWPDRPPLDDDETELDLK